MHEKQKIIDIIRSMSGRYAPYDIFYDWVKCFAIALQNNCMLIHNATWQQRDKDFVDTMTKYTREEQQKIEEMSALLVSALDNEIADVLGEIYMKSGCGNKNTGQFFTPFHLSKLNAGLMIPKDIDINKKIELNEPSCGGGGMIIAVAAVLKERGINYQKIMDVVAQDIDWKSVYMTYIQLSLLGIRATVAQGDTLITPYHKGHPKDRVFYTLAKLGAIN